MSLFRVLDFDGSEDQYILTVVSNNLIHQVLKSWKNTDIKLDIQTTYKFVLFNLTDYSLCSVSFSAESIPYQEFSLPFYKDLNSDFFDFESLKSPDFSLNVSNTQSPGQYFTIDINYEIDDEPLVHLNCEKSHFSLELPNESILSDAYGAKLENFTILLEKEEKQRKNAEEKLEEIIKSYEKYLQDSQKTEESLRKNIEELEIERTNTRAQITSLEHKIQDLNFQLKSSKDNLDFQVLKIKSFNEKNLIEEMQIYKTLYEKSEKKLQEIIDKVEKPYEDDPITLLMKDKDDALAKSIKENSELKEEIMKTKEELLRINESISEHQGCIVMTQMIAKKLEQENIKFVKEKELVFSVNGLKVVVYLQDDRLTMRKISGFYQYESNFSTPMHKRSKTDFKSALSTTLKRPNIGRIQSPNMKKRV